MNTTDVSKELTEITIPWPPTGDDAELTEEQRKLFDVRWAETLSERPKANDPDTWPYQISHAPGLPRGEAWQFIEPKLEPDRNVSSAWVDENYQLPYPWSVSYGDYIKFPCPQEHEGRKWAVYLDTGMVDPLECCDCGLDELDGQRAEVVFYGERVAAKRRILAGLVTSSTQLRIDTEQHPVVEDTIMSHALTWLAGRPAAGKSVLALHLGGCIVNGLPFLGHTIKQPGTVMYLCAERYQSLEPRRLAWEAHHGVSIGLDRTSGPRLIIHPGAIHGALQWRVLAAVVGNEECAAVILDTQSEFVDDMDRAAMRVFISGLQAVAATGAAVIVLHHTTEGKDRLAGLDQQTRAADAIMTLNMSGKTRRLVSTKNSLGPHFAPVSFNLVEAAESVTILSLNPVSTVDLQSHSAVRQTFRTLTPKAQELWISWWDQFETGDVDTDQLLSITDASRATAYRHIQSLVTAGVADPVGGERLSTYRLNQAPDK